MLIDNNYIIILKHLNVWECIPPANNKPWNNIRISAVFETSYVDILKKSSIDEHGFYLDSSLSICFTVEMKHNMMYGFCYNNYLHSVLPCMHGWVIHDDNVQSLKDNNEWPITEELQSKDQCFMQFPNLSLLENTRNLKKCNLTVFNNNPDNITIVDDYKTAYDWAMFSNKTTIVDYHLGQITCEYDFAFKMQYETLCLSKISQISIIYGAKRYGLVSLNDRNYVKMCELLSTKLDMTLIGNVAYVCSNATTRATTQWLIGEIVGFKENVLVWNC
jgi:hypothetical protein